MPASYRKSSKRKPANAVVEVVSGNARYRSLERGVRRALKAALGMLKKEGLVEAFLVDDRTMRRLNKRYRGKDKPTNVLSFSWPRRFAAFNTAARPLGEIYLGPDYIRKHGEDVSFMAIHGLLHLLGYDHDKPSERKRMEAAERRIAAFQNPAHTR